MASSGQQVTLTVAKQGAVYHGLAMLLCQDPPQLLPSTIHCFFLLPMRHYASAVYAVVCVSVCHELLVFCQNS